MQRYYGKFLCKCGNNWSSGCAWVEWDYESKELKALGQECRLVHCRRNNYPSIIRPLRYTQQGTSQMPHDITACEMCKKHGKDCRTLAEEGSADSDDDDDGATCVFSEGPSVTTEEDRDDLTPVPSDEEDLDEQLSRRVGNLRI